MKIISKFAHIGHVYTHIVAISILILLLSTKGYGQNIEHKHEVVDLSGTWKFSICDSLAWAKRGFDDDDWDDITVPSSWEDQGYHGYNGTGWYRRSFRLPATSAEKILWLYLGYIDDVDEVFVNGRLVGFSGNFPPDFQSAYNALRIYPLPLTDLNPGGENVIAVRVYDKRLAGGIVKGEQGVYAEKNPLPLITDLRGVWKFRTGDKDVWKQKNFDDSQWTKIIVPEEWEDQGFREYDGVAWYRKTFRIGRSFDDNTQLVINLGKTDDIEELYLNGELLNSKRRIFKDRSKIELHGAYKEQSTYFIDAQKITPYSNNTIAVRVYDKKGDGGIYRGTIGISRKDNYVKYCNQKENQHHK